MIEPRIKFDCEAVDAEDSLRPFRARFAMPKPADGREVLYFTGNSLGLMPKTAPAYVQQEMDDWEKLGVEAHMHAKTPWLPYHEFLTEQMARIIGAKPVETIVMNSLTVNLHLLMVSFYRPTSERYKIVIEKGAFPSDQYAVKSQIKFHRSEPPALAGGRDASNRSRSIYPIVDVGGVSMPPAYAGGSDLLAKANPPCGPKT